MAKMKQSCAPLKGQKGEEKRKKSSIEINEENETACGHPWAAVLSNRAWEHMHVPLQQLLVPKKIGRACENGWVQMAALKPRDTVGGG